jgi:hypothetical protein
MARKSAVTTSQTRYWRLKSPLPIEPGFVKTTDISLPLSTMTVLPGTVKPLLNVTDTVPVQSPLTV